MIVGLDGVITLKKENYIYINVNNITYQVFVSKNSITHLNIDEKTTLNILHIIKEDSQTLYGFIDKNEQIIFQRVIKINGVGPKIALEICSHFTPKSFYEMIQSNDINLLKQVSGIGAKSAGKILVELNGFSIDMLENTENINPFYSDALSALSSLGFTKANIQKALNDSPNAKDTQSLVKEALKKLGKK